MTLHLAVTFQNFQTFPCVRAFSTRLILVQQTQTLVSNKMHSVHTA